MTIIPREPLRTLVRRALLARLLSGEMEPGSRINEVSLAAELGVSRTPLREALIHLEFEGFIESAQGKGFSVAPLREKTRRELHVLVGLLESHAVEGLASLPGERLDAVIAELQDISDQLDAEMQEGDPEDSERLIQLGNRWHSALVSAADNEQLHEVLDLLRQRMYRYTYAFLSRRQRVGGRLEQHQKMIEALQRRDFEAAVDMARSHWILDETPVAAPASVGAARSDQEGVAS